MKSVNFCSMAYVNVSRPLLASVVESGHANSESQIDGPDVEDVKWTHGPVCVFTLHGFIKGSVLLVAMSGFQSMTLWAAASVILAMCSWALVWQWLLNQGQPMPERGVILVVLQQFPIPNRMSGIIPWRRFPGCRGHRASTVDTTSSIFLPSSCCFPEYPPCPSPTP